MREKKCPRCVKTKPLSEFYKDPSRRDGYRCLCKACLSLSAAKYKVNNRDSVKDQQKRWTKTPRGREYARVAARRYAKTPSGKAYRMEYSRRWFEADPLRRKAHGKVYRAVKSGKLTRQPCEVCGSETIHAHHSDYSKPLDVIWLCQLHHKQMHAERHP